MKQENVAAHEAAAILPLQYAGKALLQSRI